MKLRLLLTFIWTLSCLQTALGQKPCFSNILNDLVEDDSQRAQTLLAAENNKLKISRKNSLRIRKQRDYRLGLLNEYIESGRFGHYFQFSIADEVVHTVQGEMVFSEKAEKLFLATTEEKLGREITRTEKFGTRVSKKSIRERMQQWWDNINLPDSDVP